MLSDLRFAVRLLVKSPGFMAVAVLSLALGIGANSAIFCLIDGLWLRPLGIPDFGNLVRVFSTTGQEPFGGLSYPEYLDLQQQTGAFSSLVAIGRRGAGYYRGEERKLLLVNVSSPNFFSAMGVKPALGRVFGPDDPNEAVVVIGNNLWRREFGTDPNIVGKSVRLTMAQVTIIGVLPAEFRDTEASSDRDLWVSPRTW